MFLISPLQSTDKFAGQIPLIDPAKGSGSQYSTTVIRSHPSQTSSGLSPSPSSVLTIKASQDPHATPGNTLPTIPNISSLLSDGKNIPAGSDILGSSSILSIASIDTYHTAADHATHRSHSVISSAYATEGGSSIRSVHPNAPMVHRFTLLKPGGAKQKRNSGSASPSGTGVEGQGQGWNRNPLEMLFASGLLVGKCDLCNKRIGWKPVLECDDCGLRCVVELVSGFLGDE